MLFSSEIVYHPDSRLRKVSKPVDLSRHEKDAVKLCNIMRDVVSRERGLGLSAIQIGVPWQMFVMYTDPDFKQTPICLINPRIISVNDKTYEIPEGCLSIPGLIVKLKRPQSVMMEYENLKGERCRQEFHDIIAVCAQHEMDHCKGVLIIDYLTSQDQDFVAEHYEKHVKNGRKFESEDDYMVFEGEYRR